MESFYKREDKQLIFKLEEDIDEYTVQKIRRKLDNDIERYMPKEVMQGGCNSASCIQR